MRKRGVATRGSKILQRINWMGRGCGAGRAGCLWVMNCCRAHCGSDKYSTRQSQSVRGGQRGQLQWEGEPLLPLPPLRLFGQPRRTRIGRVLLLAVTGQDPRLHKASKCRTPAPSTTFRVQRPGVLVTTWRQDGTPPDPKKEASAKSPSQQRHCLTRCRRFCLVFLLVKTPISFDEKRSLLSPSASPQVTPTRRRRVRLHQSPPPPSTECRYPGADGHFSCEVCQAASSSETSPSGIFSSLSVVQGEESCGQVRRDQTSSRIPFCLIVLCIAD